MLRLFQVLVIKNNTAMGTGVQISLRDSDFVSFRYITKSGIAGSNLKQLLLKNSSYNR